MTTNNILFQQFCCLFVMVASYSQYHYIADKNFDGKVIVTDVIRNVSSASVIMCGNICSHDNNCNSYYYNSKILHCLISPTDSINVAMAVSMDDFIYYKQASKKLEGFSDTSPAVDLSTVKSVTSQLSDLVPTTTHETESVCDIPGYYHDIKTNLCFKVHEERANHSIAMEQCLDEGGRLIQIDEDRKQLIIKTYLESYPTALSTIYINGGDYGEEGKFVFHDGTPMTYFNWAPDEPHVLTAETQDCIVIVTSLNYEWDDRVCDVKRYYICEKVMS